MTYLASRTSEKHHHATAGFAALYPYMGKVLQEARAKDMISQLKLEMNNLTRLVEAGAGLSIGEEATMNELLKQKEDLTKERDAQVPAVSCILSAMFSPV